MFSFFCGYTSWCTMKSSTFILQLYNRYVSLWVLYYTILQVLLCKCDNTPIRRGLMSQDTNNIYYHVSVIDLLHDCLIMMKLKAEMLLSSMGRYSHCFQFIVFKIVSHFLERPNLYILSVSISLTLKVFPGLFSHLFVRSMYCQYEVSFALQLFSQLIVSVSFYCTQLVSC